MDPIADISNDTVRLLLPMAGVLRIDPFDGDSGLAGSGLSVHRAVYANGRYGAGVAVDPASSWNRAAMRAVTRRYRFGSRRGRRASGSLLDAAASADPDVGSLHRRLTQAGCWVGLRLVAPTRRYQTVQCEIWSPGIGETCRGNGVASLLDAAMLEAMLDAAACAVETFWRQSNTSGT